MFTTTLTLEERIARAQTQLAKGEGEPQESIREGSESRKEDCSLLLSCVTRSARLTGNL